MNSAIFLQTRPIKAATVAAAAQKLLQPTGPPAELIAEAPDRTARRDLLDHPLITETGPVLRRDRLSGVLHEYTRQAVGYSDVTS